MGRTANRPTTGKSRSASGKPTGTASSDPSPTQETRPAPPSPHRPARALPASMLELVQRSDGWLRVVPEQDGGSVYIKWKFSRGPWQGYYVMAVVQYWQLDYGLELLVDKLANVDDGLKRPTRDTAYSDI